MLIHQGVDLLRIGDFLAVDGDNQITTQQDEGVSDIRLLVAAAKSGTLCRATWDDLLDQDSLFGGEAHFGGQIGTNGEGNYAQGWALDLTVAR